MYLTEKLLWQQKTIQLPIGNKFFCYLIEPSDGVIDEALLNFFGVNRVRTRFPESWLGFGERRIVRLFLEDGGKVVLNGEHLVFEFGFDKVIDDGIFTVLVIIFEFLRTAFPIHPLLVILL